MKKIREGMYDIGTVTVGDCKSTIIVNLNKGIIVFNNSNRGNGAAWSDIEKLSNIMKETCKPNHKYIKEKWYALYKKFIQNIPADEYNTMIEKMNMGII